MTNFKKLTLAMALAVSVSASSAYADGIKIAFMGPMSGPFAVVGESALHQFQYAAEELVNKQGGVLNGQTFEIIDFDNKFSPEEALVQLQVAISRGIRFIATGASSAVAHAVVDAVDKHNLRNPENRVMFLDYAALDPALTNEDCSFWHFRFDANSDMKMDALTDVMAKNVDLKKVYVIGQDYSFGKAVAAAAEKFLGEKRPDIEIVGNELHPIGKVKDFTPYARKIINSGAQAVVTGNFGTDMLGLGKALIEAGFEGPIYTYNAGSGGITRAFGADGKNRIRLVQEGAFNPPRSERMSAYIDGFEARYADEDIMQPRIANVVEMLAEAINKAGTADDVQKVASALEGMEHQSIWGGKVYIRPSDHQAIQNLYITVHTDENIRHPLDNSEYGLFVESVVEAASKDIPTSCEMKRP